jgi:two-component system response regulator
LTPKHIDVLLVEDNPDDAELTLGALGRCGIVDNVVHVADGAEAIEFIFGTGAYAGRETSSTPRVILLDLKLPKLNGFDVLERLRTSKETRRLPVVILTSSNEECDRRLGYDLGVNGYVVKPVGFEAYNAAIAAIYRFWLRHNQLAS